MCCSSLIRIVMTVHKGLMTRRWGGVGLRKIRRRSQAASNDRRTVLQLMTAQEYQVILIMK